MADQHAALSRREVGELADDLVNAGFSIVGLDVMGGRWAPERALEHVRARAQPDGPWNEDGRRRAQAVLDKWRARGVR